jgi:hypothetical protein
LVATAGCVDFGDDTSGDSTTTAPLVSVPTVASETTLAPLTTWPAGVVWGDFADGSIEFNLPPAEPDAAAVRAVDGPAGRVAVGRSFGSSGALGPIVDLSQARIWFQEGDAWQAVEETGLPNGTSALYDVASWAGGYVAVGFHADAYERQATGVVLTSTDGRTWALSGQLPSTWSGWGSRVRITSTGAVLVEVSVAVCSGGSQFVNQPAQVTVPALWTAAAPTAAYNEVPTSALAALSPDKPTPSDVDGCFADFFTVPADRQAATFGTELGSIAAIGDRLAVLDPSATTLSVSDDLTEWVRVELPDAVEDPLGSLLYADANGRINIVTVANRPLGEGYVAGTTDPDAWVSTAWVETIGGELQRVPPWRPVYAKNLTFLDLELRDGVVRLLALAPSGSPGAPQALRVAESSPTAPQPAPTCTPAAMADCNFVTLDGAQLAGADLGGIQLYGATITGGALDNANLDQAQMARVTITGTSLTGAYLTGAKLLGARFVQANLSAASLAYADLTAATFTGSSLGGAILAGASMDGTTVDDGTTCPNGQPPTPNAGSVIVVACGL